MRNIGDAGHGGKDSGALSLDKAVKEKDLALATTLGVRELILPHLPQTYLTRATDKFLTLNERARRANNSKAAFWSIHYNAGGGRGIEVFTSPGQTRSDEFATDVLEELDAVSDRPMRLDFSDGDPDKEARFTVLTKTKGPAILIEVGFMDNAQDLAHVMNPVNADRICRGIARGILRFAGLSPSLIPRLGKTLGKKEESSPPETQLTVEDRLLRIETHLQLR